MGGMGSRVLRSQDRAAWSVVGTDDGQILTERLEPVYDSTFSI